MTATLVIRRAGPGMSVQDLGRPGYLDQGISVGGAADGLALAEGAALLGQPADCAAIEMAGAGGIFEAAGAPLRVALTGAPMQATIEGEKAAWNASHLLHRGQKISIGAAKSGNYGYLNVGGGIATAPVLGSRAAHLTAGLGAALRDGDALPVGADRGRTGTGMTLEVADRFRGGTVRIVPSVQTGRFAEADLRRFEATEFTRDARGNRMGVRMNFEGAPFAAADQLSILSEIIVPGDIQATGDGTPFVLLCECQTTGGYPRVATVVPCDLNIVAQARTGDRVRFEFVTRDAELAAYRAADEHLAGLPKANRRLVRDPHDIPDLLGYQLIDGMVAGDEEDER